jgi:hypothetical protein
METIASFEKLRYLNVRDTLVSDAGLAELYGHSELTELMVGNSSRPKLITDDSLGTLSNFKSLRRLDISSTDISDSAPIKAALPKCNIEH